MHGKRNCNPRQLSAADTVDDAAAQSVTSAAHYCSLSHTANLGFYKLTNNYSRAAGATRFRFRSLGFSGFCPTFQKIVFFWIGHVFLDKDRDDLTQTFHLQNKDRTQKETKKLVRS